jgi:hypothetical protein
MPDESAEIRLTIPGTPEFLRLARLAAADAGSRAGLTYEEIEDLRIGVDELSHSVMSAGGGQSLTLVFRLQPGTVVVEGSRLAATFAKEVDQSDLSRTIVAAVVDEHEIGRDGDTLTFRLIKRAVDR